jgi:hypothetical protein
MQPSLPVPIDNIYKFACLFGLALIVSAIFSFVASYSSSLDRKVRYSEVVIPLEAKAERTKAEEDLLAMNRKLIAVTKDNERSANVLIGLVLGVGILLSLYGAAKWHQVVQKRDDQLAELQLRKLSAEVARLETAVSKAEAPNDG